MPRQGYHDLTPNHILRLLQVPPRDEDKRFPRSLSELYEPDPPAKADRDRTIIIIGNDDD